MHSDTPAFHSMLFDAEQNVAALKRTMSQLTTMFNINTSKSTHGSNIEQYQAIVRAIKSETGVYINDITGNPTITGYFLEGLKNNVEGAGISVRFSFPESQGEPLPHPLHSRFQVTYHWQRGEDKLKVSMIIKGAGGFASHHQNPDFILVDVDAETTAENDLLPSLTLTEIQAFKELAFALLRNRLSLNGCDADIHPDTLSEATGTDEKINAMATQIDTARQSLYAIADTLLSPR